MRQRFTSLISKAVGKAGGAPLIIAGDLMPRIRIGNSCSRDTTPDLTFLVNSGSVSWNNLCENVGSDHYILTASVEVQSNPPRELEFTDWDSSAKSGSRVMTTASPRTFLGARVSIGLEVTGPARTLKGLSQTFERTLITARGLPPRGSLSRAFRANSVYELHVLHAVKSLEPRPPVSSGQDQRYRSSAFSTSASPAMDPSTGAIPKRPRKRKVKAKHSFGSTSSEMQANFSDPIAHLEKSQRDEAEEALPNLTVNTNEEVGPSTSTTTGENYKAESVHASNTLAKNCDVTKSKLVHHPSSIGRHDHISTVETPEPKALTGADVEDIMRDMRQLLLDKGPSQEQELLDAVSPLHAEQVVQVHGTMTAFLNQHPGFAVVNEDLYSFVYYDPDATTRTRQFAMADLTVNVLPSLRADLLMIPLSKENTRREKSMVWKIAVSRREKKSKAKSQSRVSRIAEAKSTKLAHDSDVVQVEKQEPLRSSTYDVHQQRAKVGEIPHALPQKSRQRAATQQKSPAMENLKPTDANPQPPLPRPRRRRKRNQRPRPKTKPAPINKRGTPPASTMSQSSAEADERFSRPSEPPPTAAKPDKPPSTRKQADAPSSDTPCVLPSEEEAWKKTKLEEKLSRISRMAQNRRPDIAEKEMRKKIDQVRKSRGGLSGMTYNDIVELVLAQFEANAKEKSKSEESSVDNELLP
ncbi:hypothetical protein HPB50_023119 [Hyalomma asiaticum]|uniref:Uncharacterized protein n=1 Tax=Hyalomma asiaticum TaxID=266040 RepID=A0ACB7TQ48_HYAAI|nr:hypothetical protein HPB50_023119 [Hyalomma asiaticum]